MQQTFKKLLPHILVLLGFVIISLAYFSPVLQGKKIFQSDIMHYIGEAKQQTDFRAETATETYWTNSVFGGMPTYQLGAKYPNNFIKKLDLALRILPRPADYLLLYLLGFYFLLLSLKVDFKLAAIGALAFGFSTYLIIILGVGHNSKAHAIAYMPLVLSGIVLTFRKKYVLGFIVTAIAMGLELVSNHLQMTYYLLLLVIILGIVYLIDAYKKQQLPHYFKSVGLLVIAVILAVGLNATNILATKEYANESMRGKSELTINPDGSPKAVTSGLDKDYITQFSYGILETFNLYIPRFMGGGSYEDVGEDSEFYSFNIRQGASPIQAKEIVKNTPTYWGDQPIVEAPAYVGAVVLFLFVLGLFLVKGRLKWWLVGGTILSLLLSYGKNLDFLTNLFIDYVPLYNKFRAVSSIQVILELCIPVLAIFALVRLFNDYEKHEAKLKALKYSVAITGGLALLFLLFKGSLFDFVGVNDGYYRQNYGQEFISAIKDDRMAMFTADTLRTLILVLLSAGTIFLFLKNKLSEKLVVIAFGVLIVFDLVGVDRRYVNNDNFVSAKQVDKPYTANQADLDILKDNDHFRVLDLTDGAARASYFHNSLGGYTAARPKRIEHVRDFHINKGNIEVINMLNTKYFIQQNENGVFAQENPSINGNAWFIEKLQAVNSPNEEILILDSIPTKKVAVFDISKTKDLQAKTFIVDSLASIKLLESKPNYLKYTTNNNQDGFAVFSESYYGDGWNAYINNTLVKHYRVNYMLRGLDLPKGNHTIEFKFEPQVVKTGSTIALASSIVLVLLILGGLYFEFKNKQSA